MQLPVPHDLRDEFLWQALAIKVMHPEQFLPVTDVKVRLLDEPRLMLQLFLVVLMTLPQTRPSDDGKGTHREMTLGGNIIVENIYLNQAALEVTFVKVDGLGEVRVSLLLSPRRIARNFFASSDTCRRSTTTPL